MVIRHDDTAAGMDQIAVQIVDFTDFVYIASHIAPAGRHLFMCDAPERVAAFDSYAFIAFDSVVRFVRAGRCG